MKNIQYKTYFSLKVESVLIIVIPLSKSYTLESVPLNKKTNLSIEEWTLTSKSTDLSII